MVTVEQAKGQTRKRHGVVHLLGVLCLLGGAAYTISGIRFMLSPERYDVWTAALAVLWCVGCLCGLAGMVLLRVTGTRLPGRLAFVLPFIGVGGATLVWIGNFGTPQLAEEYPIMLGVRLISIVGFLLLGIATLIVRRWGGWRNGVPLLYLCAIVVGLTTSLVANIETTVLAIGLAWIAIGYAVWSAADQG